MFSSVISLAPITLNSTVCELELSLEKYSFFFKHLFVCANAHAAAYVWKSEDNMGYSVHSLHNMFINTDSHRPAGDHVKLLFAQH